MDAAAGIPTASSSLDGGAGTCQRADMLRVASGRRADREPRSDDPAELMRASYPTLLATARRLGSTATEAEDLVQEAFVETLSRHPDFEGLYQPLGYLMTVLFRASFRQRRLRWTEVPLDLQDRLEDPALPHEERLFARELLGRLAPKQRACLGLRYLFGLDDDEIADALGCARSTVRSQVARGLSTLRRLASEVQDEP
jgi:RNA polymerase sigma factor (sigma-70 family)